MKVEDKIMYHYHTKNRYDDLWKKGNIVTTNEDFISDLAEDVINSNTYYYKEQKRFELFDSIRNNINKLNDPKFIELLRNLDDSEFTDSARELGSYFDMVYGKFCNYLMRDREYIMENVRKKYYPNLPSRYNSIWICDESSKDYWYTKLRDNKVLYNVSLTGELFRTSGNFIPDIRLPLDKIEELSHKYWDPKFESEEDELETEYLFQGELKILKRINRRSTR